MTGVAEEVIRALAGSANGPGPAGEDLTSGEETLFRDGVGIVVPAGRLKPRHDVLAAGAM
jgi:hypothetical protein